MRDYWSDCSAITAQRTNYNCTTIVWPASLTSNQTWLSGSCTPATQSTICWWSLPSNATATTSTSYTQTWNWTAWSPSTSWWENQATCDFNCNSNHTWNWTSCVWNTYTITFDWNWWTWHSPTNKNVNYNSAIWALPTNPTKVGFVFNWWFTATSGWTQINSWTVYTIAWPSTYYAQWIYTYSRNNSAWWSCSVSCWWWTQSRTVTCRRSDWVTFADTFCVWPKPSTSQSCNTQACLSWSVPSYFWCGPYPSYMADYHSPASWECFNSWYNNIWIQFCDAWNVNCTCFSQTCQ